MNDIGVDKKIKAMETAGASREECYKTMVRGLTAKTMIIDKFGEEHEAEDTTNQLRAAELITKAYGDWKDNIGTSGTQVIINVGADAIAELVRMASDVRNQLNNLGSSGQQTGEIIDI